MASNTPYTPDINNDSADFVPSMGDYKTLQPFRYWCQKVLPLVYDDSLSYYELLCKVVDYLNKTMEDVETLHGDIDDMYTAFGQLQNFTNVSIDDLRTDYQNLVTYVNGYIASLDVQNEINHKLDAMALNGSLTVLMSPYIPDAVASWLSTHITPTTPVVDDTLTISGAAADAKVTGDEINGLKENIEDLNGVVTYIETLNIPTNFNSVTNEASLALSNYTDKKVFVCNKNLMPQLPSYTINGVSCTPNNDGSITLSGESVDAATFQLSYNVMPNLGPGTYTLSLNNEDTCGDNLTYINIAIDGSYQQIYARLNELDAKTTFTVNEGSRVTGARLRISGGTTIPEGFTLYPQIEQGDTATTFVKHAMSILSPTSANNKITCFKGYNYVCAQSDVVGTVTYTASLVEDYERRITILENESDDYEERISALEAHPVNLTGKTIVCFGDSLVGNYQPPNDYPSIISDLTGATVYNAGFGGCCMCDNNQTRKDFTMCRLVDSIVAGDFSAQTNSGVSITYGGTSINYVPDRIAMLEDIDWSKVDIITIAYGTNDWNSNYALDNQNDPLDTTTYLGAFRYSVEQLLTAYPNIKILVITPLWRWWDTNTGMPSEIHTDYIDANDYAKGTGYKLWQYGDALEQAAKLYHIPVFNIFWECVMTKQNRLEYFNYNDGTHPNSTGIHLMADMISDQLRTRY